jgi:hypothetical protein
MKPRRSLRNDLQRTVQILTVCFALGPVDSQSSTSGNADLCRNAALSAARETGVPHEVLLALTETGRAQGGAENGILSPWPWAVHHDGKGYWFDTKADAIAMAEKALAHGATNIDLGCFQLNIRWHAQAFSSVEDMILPDNNARYAAEYLTQLYQDSGDWVIAAGAYHSRNPDNATTYRARFETILAKIGEDPALARSAPFAGDLASGAPDPAPRENRFPLLQSGAAGQAGSIVPLLPAGDRLVGG